MPNNIWQYPFIAACLHKYFCVKRGSAWMLYLLFQLNLLVLNIDIVDNPEEYCKITSFNTVPMCVCLLYTINRHRNVVSTKFSSLIEGGTGMVLDVVWRRVADLVSCLGIPEVPHWRQINGRNLQHLLLPPNFMATRYAFQCRQEVLS